MMLAVLQSSFILLIAFGAVGILRQQSAATRHLILTAALFCSIIVPFVGPLIPAWNIERLVVGVSHKRHINFVPFVANASRDDMPNPVTTGSFQPPTQPRPSFATRAWISGASIATLYLLGGLLRIVVLRRRAVRFRDRLWMTAAAEICGSLNIRRRVQLLRNERALLGTWGLLHPCIMVPHDANTWPEERLRAVLTHELAHIKRFDWFVQVLAEIARAAYWFNPLFWFLCRRLRAESEHACDDIVLNAGMDANDYATHLLELARAQKASLQTWSPILAMAKPPHLERRFLAMLNPSLNRRPVSRTAMLIACVLALLVTVPLGAMRAHEESKPAGISTSTVPVPAAVSVAKPAKAAPKPAVKRIASKPAPAQGLADGSLSGTVSDGSGAVIPGVTLVVSNRTVTQNAVTETEVQKTISGETGAYAFPALSPGQYSLKAKLPGFAPFQTVLEIERGQTRKQDVTLSVGAIMERVTVTAAGQPKPAPLPGTPQRIRVGGNVVAANLISQVKPVYPQSARDAGIEGTVHLQGLIGRDGTLIGLNPLNFVDRDLTNAALEAVRQWRYKPTLLNNEPVEVITTIDVEFKLAQ